MKKILPASIILFIFLGCLNGVAQEGLFIRVFDETGKKIAKGYYQSCADSSITIIADDKEFAIPLLQINTIKLHRSFGTGVVEGLSVGSEIPVIGVPLGGAIGAIVDGLKRRPVIRVGMDPAKLKEARELLEMSIQ